MRTDDRIFLLIGDTGYHLVEPMFEEFPDRTLNVGIAEQDLIGIAAGLANAGFRPVCYAISNFLVHRALEQTRNDLCIHDYPVLLAGTGTGFDNGGLWATHYIVDDIGCLKPLPNMQIYSPSSAESISTAFEEIMHSPHPAYMRISKSEFSEGKPTSSVNRFVGAETKSALPGPLVIAHGKMVKHAVEAQKIFPGFSIFAMDRIKPLDEEILAKLLKDYKKIVIIEDNFSSGLYNSICQFVFDRNLPPPELHFLGPKEEYEKHIGDPKYLEERYGISPEQIARFLS